MFLPRRAIATDLLPAVEAVQVGGIYILPVIRETALSYGEAGHT